MRRQTFFLLASLAGAAVLGVLWSTWSEGDSVPNGAEPLARSSGSDSLPADSRAVVAGATGEPRREVLPAEQASEARIPVSLRVVSRESSRPVAGADLELARVGDDGLSFGSWDAFYAEPEVRGRTGAAGVVVLEVPAAGTWRCRISSPDWCLVGDPLLEVARSGSSFVLPATAGVTLSGRVLSPRGAPVPGARVLLLQNATYSLGRESGERPPYVSPANVLCARTDARGAYVLNGFLPRGGVVVHATAEGFAPGESAAFEVRLGTPAQVPDILLREPCRLRVLVRGANVPAAGARVDLLPVEESLFVFDRRHEAGAEGTLEIPDLPAGDYRLRVAAEGFVERTTEPFHVAPPLVERLVELAGGAIVAGRVVAEGGEAVAGAEVVARTSSRELRLRTDADGEFECTGLPTDTVVALEIRARDFLPRTETIDPRAGAGSRELVLRRGGALVLRVEGLGAKETAAFRVELRESEVRGAGATVRRTIERDLHGPGPFVIRGLAGRYDLELRADAGLATRRGLVIADGAETELTLELVPFEALEGAVLDALSGAPLAGASVRWELAPSGPSSEATTDANGRFKLLGTVAGRLQVERAGYVKRLEPLPLSDGTIHLEREGVIRGRVEGVPAEHVGRVAVFVEHEQDAPGSKFGQWIDVDRSGTFEVRGLAAGPHRLRAEWNALAGQELVVLERGGETQVTLYLEPIGKALVRGTVLGARGRCTVTFFRQTQGTRLVAREIPDAAGTFVIAGLEAGAHLVQVDLEEGRFFERVELVEGEQVLQLRAPEGELLVSLRDEAGGPVAGCPVQVRGPAGAHWIAESDADGLAAFRGPRGELTILAPARGRFPNLTRQALVLRFDGDEPHRVELRLARGEILLGELIGSEAASLPVTLRVIDGASELVRVELAEFGPFRIEGLPAKREILLRWSGAEREGSLSVTLPRAGPLELRLP